MAKLTLNADEFSWLARHVDRRGKVHANLNISEQKKLEATTAIYTSITAKLNSCPKSDASLNIELPLNRKELRIVQEAVLSTITRVTNTEIPEYEKRIAKGQDVQRYIDAGNALVMGLTEFQNKIQAAL